VNFALDLQKWAKGANRSIGEIRRYVLINMGGAIIADTPVATGMLKGNWQTSVGAPKTTEVPLRPANMAVAELVDAAANVRGDQPVYIVNLRPYARAIEYGHSKKRPKGMVRKNVAAFQRIVRDAVKAGKL